LLACQATRWRVSLESLQTQNEKNQLHLAHGRQKTRKVTEKLKQFQHDLQESNLSKQMLEFTLTNKLQENEITLLTEQNLRLQLQYHLEKFKRNDRDKEWLLKKKDNELSLLRLTLKEETNKLLFSEKQLLEQTKRKKEMEEEYSLLKISNRELNTVVERMYSDSENLIERMRDYEQAYSQHVKKSHVLQPIKNSYVLSLLELLKPSMSLHIKEGFLMLKTNSTTWQKTWCVAKGSEVLCYQNEKCYEATTIIPLKYHCLVCSGNNKPNSFSLQKQNNPETSYCFVASTEDQCQEWIEYLSQRIHNLSK